MGSGQSGGVNIGSIGSVEGSVVGQDQLNYEHNQISYSPEDIAAALHPLEVSVAGASPADRKEADDVIRSIAKEAAKGKRSDDGVVAGLIQKFVDLVPTAIAAVVSAFATPVLGAIAGPVSKMVIDKLRNV